MLKPVQTAPPGTNPVSLAEAKAHVRFEEADDDTLITALIGAATTHLDGWSGVLGLALMPQNWRQDYACFASRMSLPFGPVQSITSIQYFDFDGVLQTVPDTDYILYEDSLSPYVCLAPGASWPGSLQTRANAVQVLFVAGYADAAAVPLPIKQAILLLVGHWYENREAVNIGNITSELPLAVASLIAPYRRIGL